MNPAAVVLFALSATSIAFGVGFGIAVGDRSGTALLVAAGLAAGIAGLAAVGTQGRDVAVPGVGREPASLSPAGGSVWPVGLGLGTLVLATGLATGSALVLIGLAASAVAGVGWFAQSWSQHPTWTDEQNERVSSRLIMPLALPLGVTAVVLLIAFAFSRTLLAVSANAAVLIALVAALVILGVGSLVAIRGLGRTGILGVLTAGALVTAGLGVGGAVAGEREFHHAGEDAGHTTGEEAHLPEEVEEDNPVAGRDEESTATTTQEGAVAAEGEPEASAAPTIELAADDLEFDKEEITVPAVQGVVIVFTNNEDKPHNVAIRDEDGELVFRPEGGGIITGPGEQIEYELPLLEPGEEYTFFCEVHPIMKGDVIVG
ncbi:MAG: cupredoxin domain-containing protein [Actinobacteria bacterium]|nr:cupredoxin domain-containing protein [Actinomycetota bacterium]